MPICGRTWNQMGEIDMKRQPGKAKLPRGKMPPGTRVHEDKKKEKKRRWCREKGK